MTVPQSGIVAAGIGVAVSLLIGEPLAVVYCACFGLFCSAYVVADQWIDEVRDKNRAKEQTK